MAKTRSKRAAARQAERVRQQHSQSFDEVHVSRPITTRKAAKRKPQNKNPVVRFFSGIPFVSEFPWLTSIILIAVIASTLTYMHNSKLGPWHPAAKDTSCSWATSPSSVSKSGSIVRSYSKAPKNCITKTTKGIYRADIVTAKGTVSIQLDQTQAPQTVNNFVFLATHRFYDGLSFWRADTGVIQGGDPYSADASQKDKVGQGGPGYKIPDELPSSASAYQAGCVAMANSGPNTNGSQFFICVDDDTAKFQPNYSSFGTVIGGLDIAKQVQAGDAITSITVSYDPSGTPGATPTTVPTATSTPGA
jgi:cyclophilin family peptidyl-prolyl cis-trans isomerase